MFMTFCNDESGVIISAELVLVLTIAVLAMVVGLGEVALAVNTELNDVSNAFGALNQSFCVTGFLSSCNGKMKSAAGGSHFADSVDDCDTNTTCDLVTGSAGPGEAGGGNNHNRW